MTTLALMLIVVAASEPVPLASVGFQAQPAEKALADSLANTLAVRMNETGLVKVTTPADIGVVLGMERQRQLLGCSESSCVAELAGALGSRAIVTGELVKVGEVVQLSVKVLDAASSSTLFAALERHANVEALLSAVDRLGSAAALEVGRRFGKVEYRRNMLPLIGIGAGVLVASVGGVFLGLSAADHSALIAKSPPTYAAALEVQRSGQMKQSVGLGLMTAGAVVAAGSLVWMLLKPGNDVPIAFAPTPGGVTAVGRF